MSIDYVAHLRRDGDLLAAAASRDLDAQVPSCPDWNVARLVIHMGIHHRWVADSIRGGGVAPEVPGKPGLRGDELIAWLRTGIADLAALLERTDDEAPAWTWSGDNRAGFWRRRTTLETLIHRWDGENATGEASSLDPLLASDCVDEMLFVFAPRHGGEYRGRAATVSLATQDAPGHWAVEFADGRLPVIRRTEGSAPADVMVTGRAEDLALFLWGRSGPEAVSIEGDDVLASATREWLVSSP